MFTGKYSIVQSSRSYRQSQNFKIFRISLHRHKFSINVSIFQLSETADKNLKSALATDSTDKRANVLYADTITVLFEAIARVVEIHQPLVETYYGMCFPLRLRFENEIDLGVCYEMYRAAMAQGKRL